VKATVDLPSALVDRKKLVVSAIKNAAKRIDVIETASANLEDWLKSLHIKETP